MGSQGGKGGGSEKKQEGFSFIVILADVMYYSVHPFALYNEYLNLLS